MKRRMLLGLLLLGGCSGHWPTGSYSDLSAGADSEAVVDSISECTANLVPNHALVNLHVTGIDALSLMLPEALSKQGLQQNPGGLPITYVISATDPKGAFIRVSTSDGACSQYFSRDTNGILQHAGPVMVVLQ